MGGDWTKICLYIADKTYARANRGGNIPEDIKVESLDEEQLRDLNRLKEWLYRQRTSARQDSEIAERRQKEEAVAAGMKAAQPALFDL